MASMVGVGIAWASIYTYAMLSGSLPYGLLHGSFQLLYRNQLVAASILGF
jgi:hypothetical protein